MADRAIYKQIAVIMVAIGLFSAKASGGMVIAWGSDNYETCDVVIGNDFVQVAGGAFHSVALRSDGTIAAWGGSGSCRER